MTSTMILEHMSLVVAALIFAILAGIPLGIICYFYPSTRKVILRVVDLIQTTPALALLGIIMVFMGAGKPTVIVGLALYSLLPIVRNTCLGLDQVPEHLIEAGKGMGMTRMYRLIHVEIPIAAPIIFTGIRIATVTAIGTAVFASFVGGGGLGSVITTGIRQEDMTAILGGTGVLMAAALILDLLMGLAERYLNSRSSQRSKGSRYAARGAAVLSAAAAVVLCVYAFLPKSTEGLLLYEGQYSEIKLVNSMIKQLVEDRHDLTVTIQDEMTAVNNFNAMTGDNHTCDLMYTWDGTLLTTIMGLDTTDIPDGQTLYDFVNEKMNDEYDMHMLGKIGVNKYPGRHPGGGGHLQPQDHQRPCPHRRGAALRRRAGLLHRRGQYEVRPHGGGLRPGVCRGQAGGHYDEIHPGGAGGLRRNGGLRYRRSEQAGQPDPAGGRPALLPRLLRHHSGAQRREAPELEDTLKLLNNQFTDEMMSELTYYVDVEGRDVDEVAHEFLVSAGLLEE